MGETGVSAYPPPPWLTTLARDLPTFPGERFSRYLPPPEGGRRDSAVLVLFAPSVERPWDQDETTVIITERAHTMRSHAGQPAFPGGGSEASDAGPADTALREAWEEVDLDPASVDVLAHLPTLHIPVSRYDVTPVVGWWREPRPDSLRAKDRSEVARVVAADTQLAARPGGPFPGGASERLRGAGLGRRRPARLGVHRGTAGHPARPGRADPSLAGGRAHPVDRLN